MWDVRRLRLLRELSVRGSLAAVADALHQSPSSASQQLTQLEREVGLPLLVKSGRGVQLTPHAEILVEHTEAILQRLELAESLRPDRRFDEPSGPSGWRSSSRPRWALIPRTLARLREHERLRVTVTQREPETALLETFARDFDLVVAEQYPGHAAPWHHELDRDALVQDAIRLAVPTEWDGIGSLADAAAVPWVAEPNRAASRHYAEQTCLQAGFDPDVRYETADLQVHVALIASGNAVALMPGLMWQGRPTRPSASSTCPATPGARCSPPPAAPPPTARRCWRCARPCRRRRGTLPRRLEKIQNQSYRTDPGSTPGAPAPGRGRPVRRKRCIGSRPSLPGASLNRRGESPGEQLEHVVEHVIGYPAAGGPVRPAHPHEVADAGVGVGDDLGVVAGVDLPGQVGDAHAAGVAPGQLLVVLAEYPRRDESDSRTIRSIQGRLDTMSKNARKQARSLARWLSSARSTAIAIARRRSRLIARTTAAKISALESKYA